ncbi:unnamed protein product [Periconia digitata]|uniref:Uncharacterized protein n=1 Tax=Periconia digitata TaxID=1303443 RepID=A0A9W4U767_9PLEO|nr:unnamed protein product [Periconia digitata]
MHARPNTLIHTHLSFLRLQCSKTTISYICLFCEDILVSFFIPCQSSTIHHTSHNRKLQALPEFFSQKLRPAKPSLFILAPFQDQARYLQQAKSHVDNIDQYEEAQTAKQCILHVPDQFPTLITTIPQYSSRID